MTATATPKRLRKVDVRLFRRTLKARGDTIKALATGFGVSRRHLYRVLEGEVSAPLVRKINEYIYGTEAA